MRDAVMERLWGIGGCLAVDRWGAAWRALRAMHTCQTSRTLGAGRLLSLPATAQEKRFLLATHSSRTPLPSLRPHPCLPDLGAGSEGAAAAGEDAEQARRREHLAATGNPSPVLPFGITLLAPAWTDAYVAGLAGAYAAATGLTAGPRGHGVEPYKRPS
jgi:hypothetical protein